MSINRRREAAIVCPACLSDAGMGVTDSRPTLDNGVKRRRQCRACGARFTTHERITNVQYRSGPAVDVLRIADDLAETAERLRKAVVQEDWIGLDDDEADPLRRADGGAA